MQGHFTSRPELYDFISLHALGDLELADLGIQVDLRLFNSVADAYFELSVLIHEVLHLFHHLLEALIHALDTNLLDVALGLYTLNLNNLVVHLGLELLLLLATEGGVFSEVVVDSIKNEDGLRSSLLIAINFSIGFLPLSLLIIILLFRTTARYFCVDSVEVDSFQSLKLGLVAHCALHVLTEQVAIR